MYRRYENLIGSAIEQTAKESCQKAALEEQQQVIDNIEKMKDFL